MNILITKFMGLSLSPNHLIVKFYVLYIGFVKMCKFKKVSGAWCFLEN
jgi:hypothetical protein